MKDILLVDKPKGITSFDVIRKLRKTLGIKKMGHAGTLDPLATGLMIIGINDGTKKLNNYLKLSKTYTAEILCGVSTTTDDLEGDVEDVMNCAIDESNANEVLNELKGIISLQVPLYSAIKIDGKPLYKYAREGIDIIPPTRDMEIRDIEFVSMKEISFDIEENKVSLGGGEYHGQLITVHIDVASGVYIRSIAREIGRQLNCSATLSNLRRTSVGEFRIEEALPLDEINGG